MNGKRECYRRVSYLVIALGVAAILTASPALSSVSIRFSTPILVGYLRGDDWEPDVAADAFGNVYVAWAHFGDVPGCDTCSSPAAMIQISRDGGKTFGAPKPLNPTPVNPMDDYQIDLQVKVNSKGTVFIAYLDGKDTVFQRSDDFGRSFSKAVPVNVGIKKSYTDKVGLALKDEDVYVAFNIAQRFYVSHSHNGGKTWKAVQLNYESATYSWTLTSGGVVDSKGNVYFSWVGVHQSGNAKGPQDLFLTKSTDGGMTWSFIDIEKGVPPGPDCPVYCGWDFWGPQIVVGVDTSDQAYVAYFAGLVDEGSPFVWFRTSKDGGMSWSEKVMVNADGTNAYHLFTAIVGGGAGEVHVSWMDNRTGRFNTWYRTSKDGGRTWSAEVQVSQFIEGFKYKSEAGYEFTYGDYYGIARDGRGKVHIAWGEGPDYIGPGNVFYARQE